MRLDQLLSKSFPEHSRAFWQKLIGEHRVLVNGHPQKMHQPVKVEDKIEVIWPERRPVEKTLPNTKLDIVFEDLDVLILNKPAGVVVHPAHGHETGTLIEQVAEYCGFVPQEFTDTLRPGLIHRLDKETSGALMIAKNSVSQNFLARNLSERKFEKHYLALVYGRLNVKEGLIDAPIGRGRDDRRKMVITGGVDAREAKTHYKVLEEVKLKKAWVSLVELRLLTGRTHQIRVHMASLGHPVLGDEKYGKTEDLALSKELGIGRQFLHAWILGFPHPETGKMMYVKAPLPKDLTEVFKTLEIEEPKEKKI